MNTSKEVDILRVYVSDCCFVCTSTPETIREIKKNFPVLVVKIINIDQTREEEIPESIFSIPTYTLNGKTVSLGNPSPDFYTKLKKLIKSF